MVSLLRAGVTGQLRLPWDGCLPCVCVLGREGHFIISLEETIPLENALLFTWLQGFV